MQLKIPYMNEDLNGSDEEEGEKTVYKIEYKKDNDGKLLLFLNHKSICLL